MEDEVVLKQMKKYRIFSIVGIILFIVLIIFQCYLIFWDTCSAPSYAPSSVSSIREIDAFNSQFSSYEGNMVKGSNVNSLIAKIAANVGTFQDEPSKVPTVMYENSEESELITYEIENKNEYTKKVTKIKNKIISKKTYRVEFEYSDSGYINLIKIAENGEYKLEGNTIIVELDQN